MRATLGKVRLVDDIDMYSPGPRSDPIMAGGGGVDRAWVHGLKGPQVSVEAPGIGEGASGEKRRRNKPVMGLALPRLPRASEECQKVQDILNQSKPSRLFGRLICQGCIKHYSDGL